VTDEARITAIRPHRRNADRVEIDIGDRTLVVSPEFVVRAGLRAGATLTAADRQALEAETAVVQAFDRALLLLAHRARSRAELARRLTRLGLAAAAIDVALQRLARLGYLDDAAFARQLARGRLFANGQSRSRIRSELLRKGVDRQTADGAIEEALAGEDVDEDSIIERVASKKARSLAKLDAPTRRRRLYGFLARRGFDADEIRRVLERLVEDGSSDGEETAPST
jgi:regulatory protein